MANKQKNQSFAFRLNPGQYLREEIEEKAFKNKIGAGVLLSIVGSLKNANLRMAGLKTDKETIKKLKGPFEIVSGTGTISKNGCHIHISLADKNGKVIGGHLKDGCEVETTAEIIIGIIKGVIFERKFDKVTGFEELNIK